MREVKIEDLRNLLKEKGIQPSYHRLQVLKFLMENRVHPTVDMIYRDLAKKIPTLSKTTVYNTLNLFAEKGLVNVLTIEEREARYDIDTSFHAHFKCEKCGMVYDVKRVDVKISDEELKGFEIGSIHLYIKGICPECRRDS